MKKNEKDRKKFEPGAKKDLQWFIEDFLEKGKPEGDIAITLLYPSGKNVRNVRNVRLHQISCQFCHFIWKDLPWSHLELIFAMKEPVIAGKRTLIA